MNVFLAQSQSARDAIPIIIEPPPLPWFTPYIAPGMWGIRAILLFLLLLFSVYALKKNNNAIRNFALILNVLLGMSLFTEYFLFGIGLTTLFHTPNFLIRFLILFCILLFSVNCLIFSQRVSHEKYDK